jgi:hypothetical protein
MATYSRLGLSGTTNGRTLQVTSTAGGASSQIVHTAVAGTSAWDEIYIWATNTSGVVATLTIEWGGVSADGDYICKTLSIPANSPPIPIVTGEVLQNGLLCKAFAGTASVINITGYVNRIA